MSVHVPVRNTLNETISRMSVSPMDNSHVKPWVEYHLLWKSLWITKSLEKGMSHFLLVVSSSLIGICYVGGEVWAGNFVLLDTMKKAQLEKRNWKINMC